MMVSDAQRVGGIAALVGAATIVVGLGMFATLLTDYTTGDPTPAESVTFLADNEATIYVWNLVTLVVFAVALVPFALALHDRLRTGSPALSRTATAFGIIWAGLLLGSGMVLNIGATTIVDLHATDPDRAESLWLAIDSVGNGLGGGMEIVGSVWVLLVSLAGLRTTTLPRASSYLGFVMAAAGLITVVPALEIVGAIFGLGLIVWFAWLGTIMLREGVPEEVSPIFVDP